MAISKSLDIIVVNYRSAALVVDCLASLMPEINQIPDARIWLVENGSDDNSSVVLTEVIKKNDWSNRVTLVRLDENRGFAGGNNAAINQAVKRRSDYVLLLNPDTLARPGAISAMLAFMDQHPRAGIIGSRLEGSDGSPQISAFTFPSWISEFENGFRLGIVSRILRRWVVARAISDEALRTDWVSGACMMIRREVFERIGLLDDRYFMYFEELDFCRRAHQAGWECWYCPDARVVHLIGRSSGIGAPGQQRRRRPRYWFESRARYFRKNHGRGYKLLADLAWVIGYSMYRARAFVQRKIVEDSAWLWWDFVRYNRPHRGISDANGHSHSGRGNRPKRRRATSPLP